MAGRIYYEDVVSMAKAGTIHIAKKENEEFALCGHRFGTIRMKITSPLKKFKDLVCEKCLAESESEVNDE